MANATDFAAITGNFIPPGVVAPFAGSTAPSGWLLCDGSDISTTTYAALYAAIGSTYNTQINPTTGLAYAAPTGFRVPDYRGIFIRGVGTASGLDAVTLGAHQVHKTAANGLTVSGGTASLSGNAAPHSHNHPVSFTFGRAAYTVGDGAAGFAGCRYTHGSEAVLWPDDRSSGTNTGSAVTLTNTAASLGAGDNETRPINKGVNYIIKY